LKNIWKLVKKDLLRDSKHPWGLVVFMIIPVMTAVIIVQGLLFQDGGILSMGWNILNMGAFSVLTGYVTYSLLHRFLGNRRKVEPFISFSAAWISVETGAIAVALQLAASGTFPLQLALPALTGIYALIGLAEGLVTVAALSFIRGSYPELLQGDAAPGRVSATFLSFCLALALLLCITAIFRLKKSLSREIQKRLLPLLNHHCDIEFNCQAPR